MPDWNALVEQALGKRNDPEVVAELAAHLEDHCASLVSEGIDEREAMDRAIVALSSSRHLKRNIERARGGCMNHRSKALWLPGLVSLTASAGLLAILQIIAMHSRSSLTTMTAAQGGSAAGWNFLPYVLWIILQPACGALAAWLSKRAGGWRVETIAAGLFPSLIMLATMFFGVAFAVVVERNAYITSHWLMLGEAIAIWVVAPGVGLIIGTLPFLSAKTFVPLSQIAR